MPLASRPVAIADGVDPREFSPPADPRAPTGGEIWRAANALENWVYDPDDDLKAVFPEEPGFELLRSLPEPYRNRADLFADVKSTDEMNARIAKVSREDGRRRVIQNAGFTGTMAMMAAASIQPAELLAMAVPGGLVLRGSMTGARALATGAALTVAPVVQSEYMLQQQQVTRTEEETMINIAAAALVSGLFSGVAYAAARPMRELHMAMREEVAGHLKRELPNFVGDGSSSVGAAARKTLMPLEQTEIATGAKGLSRFFAATGLSPKSYMETRRNPLVRAFAEMVAESNTYKNYHFDGVAGAQAIETQLSVQYGRLGSAGNKLRYDAYRAVDADGLTLPQRYGNEFKADTEVFRAFRNNDQHRDPAVAKLAADYRREVWDPVKTRLEALGALPADFTPPGAASYAPRVYHIQKIEQNSDAFRQDITRFLEMTGVERGEALETAFDIQQTILREPQGRMVDFQGPSVSTLTRERTLKIPDSVLEPWLVNDLEVVTDHYLGTYLPDLLIAENDLLNMLDDIRLSYNSQIDKAAGNQKLVSQLEKERDKVVDTGNFMLDKLRRKHNASQHSNSNFFYDNLVQPIKDLVFTAYMGRVLFAQLTELGYAAMELPMRQLLPALKKHVLNKNTLSLAKRMYEEDPQMMRAMGVGIEDMLHNRRFLIGGEQFTTRRGLAKYTGKTADAFAKATGMEWFTNNIKWVAGFGVQDKYLGILDKIARGEKLKTFERADLARAGIGDDMAKRIIAQGDAWRGTKAERGSFIPRLEQWTDAEAASVFANAVNKDVNYLVVTPGVGDLPMWAENTAIGSLLIQFKRFFLTGNNRIVVPMAQRLAKGDVTTAQGAVLALAMATLGIVFRDLSRDGEVKERSTQAWVKEAVDYSGLTGIAMEAFNMADRLNGNRLSNSLGITDDSRYAGPPGMGSLMGPAFGYGENLLRLGYGLSDGDLSPGDVHKIRKMTPYQNLFYLEWLFNQGEAAVQEAVE